MHHGLVTRLALANDGVSREQLVFETPLCIRSASDDKKLLQDLNNYCTVLLRSTCILQAQYKDKEVAYFLECQMGGRQIQRMDNA